MNTEGVISVNTTPTAGIVVTIVPPIYQIDTGIQFQAAFTLPGGVVPADPTDVSLFVQDPTGTVTTYTTASTPTPVVKVSTGVYTFDLTPAASGAWVYKWQGAGVLNVTSPDTYFTVQPSVLIAG